VGATIPGPVGLAVYAGVKFTEYVLAAKALKVLQPAIAAGAAKIAGLRTGLGLVLGPIATVSIGFAASRVLTHLPTNNSFYPFYVCLFTSRVLIWALVIFLFARKTQMGTRWLWACALGGAIWSSVLDLPGYGLAVISPGKIVIC
jgi:hypothetical protein